MVSPYEYPEEGELVVCSVTTVKSFGAFVNLDEYDGKEGFIHVAEVATGWVKYIRDHVREGQKVVCKVLNVDTGKGHIDLSLKQVNEHQKREKIQLWKNEQKADRLLEIVAKDAGITPEEAFSEYGIPLIDKYGSLYKAFEKAAMGLKRLNKDGFTGTFFEHFAKVAKANIAPPHVKVVGTLELSHPGGDGIDAIRESITENVNGVEDEGIHIHYLGAPRYRIEIAAEDYKEAESTLKATVESITASLEEKGGRASFSRDE